MDYINKVITSRFFISKIGLWNEYDGFESDRNSKFGKIWLLKAKILLQKARANCAPKTKVDSSIGNISDVVKNHNINLLK